MEKVEVKNILQNDYSFHYKGTQIGNAYKHYNEHFNKDVFGNIEKIKSLKSLSLFMFGKFIGEFNTESETINKANECLNDFLRAK